MVARQIGSTSGGPSDPHDPDSTWHLPPKRRKPNLSHTIPRHKELDASSLGTPPPTHSPGQFAALTTSDTDGCELLSMTRATASFPQEYYTSELSPLTYALVQDSNNWADEGVRDILQPPSFLSSFH